MNKTAKIYASIGAILGYFFIHPFIMLLGHIMEMSKKGTLDFSVSFLLSEYRSSFEIQMLPWAISIVIFNASIGCFLGKLQEQNKSLNEANAALNQANAAKDRFFSIIAHDLKGPFTVLIGFTKLMQRKYDSYSDEQKKTFLQKISSSAQETFKLLENLLSWSKMQLGGVVVEKGILELSEVTREVVSVLQHNADEKKIVLTSNIEQQFPVCADKNMLMLILRNLISNAIKFTAEDGSIDVSSKTVGKYLEICVSDTGVGIKKENLRKLFQIDTLYSETGTADEKGSGLGLILCQEFVEKHGGTISVESEVGKGSRFKVRIPQ